jgi:DNA-binding MurR/RpiR family transcriptional regulator
MHPEASKPVVPWLDGLVPTPGLSPAQARVFSAIREDPRTSSFAELSEIAGRAGVDNSTVVRCAQRLGFRGWPALQQELRARYLATLSTEQTLAEHPPTTSVLQRAIRHDIANLERAAETVDEEVLAAVVERLASARRILVVGMGSFAGPATVFAHLATTMGYDATFESRGGPHQASAVARLTAEDALVVMNFWRPIRDLVAAAGFAGAAGIPVVVLTDMYQGVLASTADHVLVIPSEGLSFFQSCTAATSVVYALLAGLQEARPERTTAAIRHIHQVWSHLGTYAD